MDYKKDKQVETPIQKFYAGQSVLITGGTGFLGKVLVEKLLRSCPDISTIYLLIRRKKSDCIKKRLDEMFKISLYDQLKEKVPNFREKIVPIIGDLNIEELGLSENDKNLLIREVSIVFHMGATVRFNEKIKISTTINVSATGAILNIAKHMSNLKSFIYVSTIYANSHIKHIKECFYTYPIDHKDLITFTHTLPENVIDQTMNKITSQWPNTYTFTKAIAESLLRHEGGDLPIGIFRPAIVISVANEPLVGWIDNWYGPSGLSGSCLHGIARFQLCNADLTVNLVPVDFTVNALIASAWDVFNQYRKGKTTLIYNFVAPINAPTWREYLNKMFAINEIYPLNNCIWFPYMIFLRQELSYKICIWFGHLLPALLVDAVRICMNRQPRMWKLYTKIHKISKAISPFCTNKWSYSTDNIQAMWGRLSDEDRQLFKFNMIDFDWSTYIINYHRGMRLYLFNEDDSNLTISRIKYKRLYWIHQTFKSIIICTALGFIGIKFLFNWYKICKSLSFST